MRRRDLVILMIGAVVVSSTVTWIAAQQIRSPAEAAARTAAPSPSPILVPVEEKVLETRVVTRGTATFGSPMALTMTGSALKSGVKVITSLPAPGSEVSLGDVLLTISGRPVLLLEGSQPSYRDLGPGMSGADVGQLEESLRKAGIDPGAVDGTYDEATGRAVAALYERHGQRPVVASNAALAQARPIEAGLVPGTRAGAGVQLPADEVVFVPAAPVRVAELPIGVGAAPDGPVVTVTGSDVIVNGALPLDQAGLVQAGAAVVVDEPSLGINASGQVAHVAERPGTEGADQFHVSFRVAVQDPPPTLVGTSVRLTVPIRSTNEAQLAVPVSAVSLGPDGGSRVERSVDGAFEFVPVETGLSADGYVSVTPTDGELAAGDLVAVGFEPPAAEG